ncbi:Prefoldin beta-like protein [Polychytrium aggregatum]|uniref:Prefoldin beta-like protein n=1 Tax=Polychytrium aggregatum TaxID=110093 RepID=UPI0022FE9808|nr:Prefoldin beta-like protein [Polychytrium aggregatum]KAI9208318.1 Prefoldin beta-like protein [Polychytrium aggregatum]
MSSSERPSDKDIISQFNALKQELQAIAQKIGELEMEKDEHQLVVDTISPLQGDRKCFRLVGGVLVERTVKEVLPAVSTNMDGISKLIQTLAQQYKKKEDDMVEFQKKWNIQVKN